MKNKEFLSTVDLAKILGISRIAVFKKIKKGQIKAVKIGRTFVIDKDSLPEITGKVIGESAKKEIETAVKKVVKEYGQTLKLLGRE